MAVRKCPKCGSVWYTELIKCAFCGIEGEEVKGPISPAKLNLSHGGISTAPPKAAEPKPAEEPAPAAVAVETPPPAPVAAPPPPPVVEAPPAEPLTPPPIERMPEPPPRPHRAPALRPVARDAEPTAPAPQIPSATVPLVFGALGLAACLLLPAVGAFQKDRALMILALLAWSILAPFAPFAWSTGQRYLDACRSLGFGPAASARTGKLLGMAATFLIVFEFAALAVFVAVQSLQGKIVCPLWK